MEAQTRTEELNMQDTNKKWDTMVNICLNAAKKDLNQRKNRYENEKIVQLSEKQKKIRPYRLNTKEETGSKEKTKSERRS